MPLVNFSEAELLILREMARRVMGGSINTFGRGRDLGDTWEDVLGPETYVAKTPSGGIPGLTSGDAGTGTGSYDEPGSANCDIYCIDESDATPDLRDIDLDQTVYNVGDAVIPGSTYIPVTRDKFGRWIAPPSTELLSWSTALAAITEKGNCPKYGVFWSGGSIINSDFPRIISNDTLPRGVGYYRHLFIAAAQKDSENYFRATACWSAADVPRRAFWAYALHPAPDPSGIPCGIIPNLALNPNPFAWQLCPWMPGEFMTASSAGTPATYPDHGTAYNITGVDAAGTGAGSFDISGDHTLEFPIGIYTTVEGSTGNDGVYLIASVSFSVDTTTITVEEDVPDATVDGTIKPTRYKYPVMRNQSIDLWCEVADPWTRTGDGLYDYVSVRPVSDANGTYKYDGVSQVTNADKPLPDITFNVAIPKSDLRYPNLIMGNRFRYKQLSDNRINIPGTAITHHIVADETVYDDLIGTVKAWVATGAGTAGFPDTPPQGWQELLYSEGRKLVGFDSSNTDYDEIDSIGSHGNIDPDPGTAGYDEEYHVVQWIERVKNSVLG